MAVFAYKAMNPDGQLVRGELEAANLVDLLLDDHDSDRAAVDQIVAAQVEIHVGVPRLVRRIQDRRAAKDARVADDDVDPAGDPSGIGEKRVDVFRAGHIRPDEGGLAIRSRYVTGRSRSFTLRRGVAVVEVGNDHMGAFAPEAQGDRAADACGPAGHDRRAPCEPHGYFRPS